MSQPKIAIIHFTLTSKVKGGGEIIDFMLRDHYNADFFSISYDSKGWDKRQGFY